MTNKRTTLLLAFLIAVGTAQVGMAEERAQAPGQMQHHPMMHTTDDGRIPLDLPPRMRMHQLANMRSHLEAVQAIVAAIAEGDFDSAADTAHAKLGMTKEMRMMCNMFENDDFKRLGLSFHESADKLADTLRTGDATGSLRALKVTMGYCVACHATFRQ